MDLFDLLEAEGTTQKISEAIQLMNIETPSLPVELANVILAQLFERGINDFGVEQCIGGCGRVGAGRFAQFT